MDGVSTGLCISPPSVLMAVEAKLQVFGKRHGPRVIGQRHHWCHLMKEADSECNRRKSGLITRRGLPCFFTSFIQLEGEGILLTDIVLLEIMLLIFYYAEMSIGGVELMVTNLFADAAPGIVENCMLITRHRGVQLL